MPTAELALEIAARVTGAEPHEARRFPTGMAHYVFEVGFRDRSPVVVRLGSEARREEMRGAAALSRLLRPRGVPLPELLADEADGPVPCLVLERLPGSDLGAVIGRLSEAQREQMAAGVAAAQAVVAGVEARPGRYGYAVSAVTAPHAAWSGVLAAHLARSRGRIAANGRYEAGAVDALRPFLERMATELDALPPVPFLHDATTKNVLVRDDGTFSGIVDVDDLCFGDPRYVVALTRASLLASDGPLTYADAWMRRAGFASDRLFRLYVALFVADFMAEQGQAFNGNEPAPDAEADRRLQGLFRRVLAEI